MITAERILQENYSTKPDIDHPYKLYWKEDVVNALKEFAELKCKELLEIVAEKVKTKTIYESDGQPSSSFPDFEYTVVDKYSVLNAVNLKEFIK
jgi:hypothetical protein